MSTEQLTHHGGTGTRALQTGPAAHSLPIECRRAQAEAADWRRLKPVARPLAIRVYGAEANARVAAQRARSTPPPSQARPAALPSGVEHCTFSPATNPRRALNPQRSTGSLAGRRHVLCCLCLDEFVTPL